MFHAMSMIAVPIFEAMIKAMGLSKTTAMINKQINVIRVDFAIFISLGCNRAFAGAAYGVGVLGENPAFVAGSGRDEGG